MAVSSRFSHKNDIGQSRFSTGLAVALAQSGQELAKIKPFAFRLNRNGGSISLF
jgi:BioD-like phosphotransacetylase family protein